MNLYRLSLRAQLNTVIMLVLSISFCGSILINIINSQSYLTKQLTSHAQDTATSLGLALSGPLVEQDKYLIESTINAIFDRGYYQHITLTKVNGELIYQRTQSYQPEQVPEWFIDLFQLVAPEQQSMIDTGWVIGAILTVQSHTGIAYGELWKSARDAAYFTLFIFFFALLLGYLVLKQIYKPIGAISEQARLVKNREFRLIETLPRATELRNFVLAMNEMISNMKSTFEELTENAESTRKSAYIDTRTGIENRRAFNDNLDALLSKSMQFHGHLGMLRITTLDTINKQLGYQAGDHLIADIIDIFNHLQSHLKIYRISGSEFAFIIENQQNKVIRNIAQSIVEALDKIKPTIKNSRLESLFALGIIRIKSEDELSQIMYLLDVQTNKSLHSLSGYCLNEMDIDTPTNHESATTFKNKITRILQDRNNAIILTKQSLQTLGRTRLFDAEIFVEFNYRGKKINTETVFSVAAQFDLSGQLDVAITEKVLGYLATAGNKRLALNISYGTYNDPNSMNKIFALLRQANIKKQLVIQFMEQSIVNNINKAQTYIKTLRASGCMICINRFGASVESLRYLIDIHPDYVKLSPSFTRNIDKKEQNALLVGAFIRMAHGLNIPIIATYVETTHELTILKKLNIDGVLGYAIDKPEAK